MLDRYYSHGGDIMTISETGSGKTLAYLLIALEEWLENRTRTLIITTNTILANQIKETVKDVLAATSLNSSDIINFRRNDHSPIRVSTISSPSLLNSANEEYSVLVVDEAQTILSESYYQKFEEIRSLMREKSRVICLQPFNGYKEQQKSVLESLKDPIVLETDNAHSIPRHIKQIFHRMKFPERDLELVKLMRDEQMTLIFVNRQSDLKTIFRLLEMYNISYESVHKPMNTEQKSRALLNFKSGKCSVLITTDGLNAGLNLPKLKRVVNWSSPPSVAIYLNRLGRLGRLDSNFVGECITFSVSPKGNHAIQKVEEAIRRNAKVNELDRNYEFNQNFYEG